MNVRNILSIVPDYLKLIFLIVLLAETVGTHFTHVRATSITSSIYTQKRGTATSTNWQFTENNMYVGHWDTPFPLNNVTYRGYAWFDIPNHVQEGTINWAKLKVKLSNTYEWNDLLFCLDLWDLGNLS